MDKASLLPLEKELYLRVLTGRLVGEHLFDGYKRVAVIVYPDRICAAMGVASLVAYTYETGYREKLGSVYTYEKDKIEEIAKEIVKDGYEVVYISYGGEQKMSVVNEAFIDTLKALEKAGYKNALAIHVRAWLASKQLSTVLQDSKLKDWLKKLKEIRVFTADTNNKKFMFHKVTISDDKPSLTLYREALLTDEHVELLKKSIPPPE